MTSQEDVKDAPPGIRRGVLVCIGGLPGVGKTTVGLQLLEYFGNNQAQLIDPDIFRAEVLGRLPQEGIREEDMAPAITSRTIERMAEAADAGLRERKTVIVPSAFVLENMRNRFETLAEKRQSAFFGFWLDAPDDCLQARLAQRDEQRKKGLRNVTTVSAVTKLNRGLIEETILWPTIDASPPPEQIVLKLMNSLSATSPKRFSLTY